MLIVGELINASRKAVASAIEAQDGEKIQNIAYEQVQAGADFIDVNAGVFVGEEADYLQWLVKTVQNGVNSPCCIDSPDPSAIEKALAVHKGGAMINSISLEKDRFEALLSLVAGSDQKVVGLCMSDEGMPETSEERVKIADQLINSLVKNNVPIDNIYVDPLVQPISTDNSFGAEFLNAIDKIMINFPGVHTICGLSNISFGLPLRSHLNQNFAVMAIARGLDSLIINPLDRRMIANIIAAETLGGRDNYCTNYLRAYREDRLDL